LRFCLDSNEANIAVLESGSAQWLALSQAKTEISYIVVDVLPKLLQPTAQVVESRLAVAGPDQAVLGTFAVAGEQELAFPALLGQGTGLVESELTLLLRENHA
jgi:hypothetical protein